MKKETERGSKEISIGVDRLSRLPDDILTHILSFLKTKEVVQTCILSKRWSNVWASVPVLKVTEREFRPSNYLFERDENRRKCMDKFVRFVDGVLGNLKVSRLDTFECFCSFSHRRNHSVEWLGRVAALMPRVIIFGGYISTVLELPGSLLSCASLQNLKLDFYDYPKINGPESIKLPSLKVLDLAYVELNDDFAQKVFSGCPALESLVLRSCVLHISDITSDVLKMLTIDSCQQTKKLRISCRGLVSLSVSSVNPEGCISLENTASLSTAVIMIHRCTNDVSILRGLSNASTIELSGTLHTMKLLEKDIPYCGTFKNLKILKLGEWDMTINFDLIACFLEKSPNLQKLYLELRESHGDIQGETRQEPMRDVLAMLEYVELVEITGRNKVQVNKLVNMLRRYIKNIGHILWGARTPPWMLNKKKLLIEN